MEELNPVEHKVCGACGLSKRIKSFPLRSTGKRGKVCNICKLRGNTLKDKEVKKRGTPIGQPLKNNAVRKEDWIDTYRFLESMGYSLSEDIHEQFCLRHNLIPNNPKELFANYFSVKDCGLN